MRPDLKFWDGKPVTSADANFLLTKVMHPAAAYGFAFQPVALLETPDDQTITINLKQPYTPILSSLSLFSIWVG